MTQSLITTLVVILSPHLNMSKPRVETFSLLLVGILQCRTVNLSHIASSLPTPAKIESTYRRLQRFFQYVHFDDKAMASFLTALTGVKGSWYLCLDRTNWKIGKSHVNFLVLIIVTRRFRLPVFWSLLGRGGTSDYLDRRKIMERYLSLFPVSTIKFLLADREFFGHDWIEFLCENGIPFTIRMKGKFVVTTELGRQCYLQTLLHRQRHASAFLHKGKIRNKTLLHFAKKRLSNGEILIIASNMPASKALAAYKKRWAIECFFAHSKTRGLNIEDTRMTDSQKLKTLFGLVAIACAWCEKSASKLMGHGSVIQKKKHGYLEKSIFRFGFDHLRKWIIYDTPKAVYPWKTFSRNMLRVV